MATTTPDLTLNNGVTMPALGFGVFQSPPEETTAAVETALRVGYRHIDTAAAYGNERQVGDAIRRSGIDRADVFIETKVWVSDYGYAETLHAFDKAIRKLGVEQLDLLILHQPAQVMLRWQVQHDRSAIPKSTNAGRIAENFDVFDFELTADELARVDALDTGVRNGPDPDLSRPDIFDRVVPEE